MGSFVFEVGVAVGTGAGFWVKVLVELADFLVSSVVLEGKVLCEITSAFLSIFLVLKGVWGKTVC